MASQTSSNARRGGRLAALAVVLAGATLAAGCAGTGGVLSGPNSRVMTLSSLDQTIKPGMTQGDVVARIGRPTYTFPVGWQNLSVWNYRFAPPEGDCTVFQISFSTATGVVTETGQGYDRYCDGPNRS